MKKLIIIMVSLITRKIGKSKSPKISWEEIEYFDPIWKERIKLMTQFILNAKSIVDLGCGECWLKEFLPEGVEYFGVDYVKRNSETIVCDFNKNQIPKIKSDYYFVSGCLEYINNVDVFIRDITQNCTKVVLSYCTVEEFSDLNARRLNAWKNDMNKSEIINKFQTNGFELAGESMTTSKNSIFFFKKTSK